MSESQCKINIELINAALNCSKRNKGEIFTIVDISKPFDMVPHSAIKPSLARKDVLTPIIDLIVEMYKGCKTTIRTRNNEGVEIETLEGHFNRATIYHSCCSIYVWSRCWMKLSRKPVAST
jgi:hypothetical protein